MRILGELETATLPPMVASMATQMRRALLGSEVVVIEYTTKEMKVLRFDFEAQRKKFRWVYTDQQMLEKAEMMHMIDIALKNAHKSNCKWFKSAAMKIAQDAREFDEHSKKTLLVAQGLVFIIIVYNGVWVGGETKNDGIIRDESDGGENEIQA